MKRLLLLFYVVVCAGAVQAAPFLVSDPYPPTAAQPTSCMYQEGSNPAVSVPVTTGAAGGFCKFDLATVARAPHDYQVWVSNAWGVSVKVPFSFSAQVPAATSGLAVTP